MTYEDFMKLPLEGRKAIEQAIVDLDSAMQKEQGISLLKPKIAKSKRLK